MITKSCPEYCGETCVNGYCPNAREDYEELGVLPKIRCSECFYNKGCEDCYFADNPEYPCTHNTIVKKVII